MHLVVAMEDLETDPAVFGQKPDDGATFHSSAPEVEGVFAKISVPTLRPSLFIWQDQRKVLALSFRCRAGVELFNFGRSWGSKRINHDVALARPALSELACTFAQKP
ncbi:MAG: hypothetical protein RMJ16_01705 [Thermoguttaceae bacterium]|nr:hypothetical protein [Thermoguttaceae bacterium]